MKIYLVTYSWCDGYNHSGDEILGCYKNYDCADDFTRSYIKEKWKPNTLLLPDITTHRGNNITRYVCGEHFYIITELEVI